SRGRRARALRPLRARPHPVDLGAPRRISRRLARAAPRQVASPPPRPDGDRGGGARRVSLAHRVSRSRPARGGDARAVGRSAHQAARRGAGRHRLVRRPHSPPPRSVGGARGGGLALARALSWIASGVATLVAAGSGLGLALLDLVARGAAAVPGGHVVMMAGWPAAATWAGVAALAWWLWHSPRRPWLIAARIAFA